MRFIESREQKDFAAFQLIASNNFNGGMHSIIYKTDLVQTWYDDRHHYTLHCDAGIIALDLHSRSQGCKKAITLCQVSH